jgi:hypothetical protein
MGEGHEDPASRVASEAMKGEAGGLVGPRIRQPKRRQSGDRPRHHMEPPGPCEHGLRQGGPLKTMQQVPEAGARPSLMSLQGIYVWDLRSETSDLGVSEPAGFRGDAQVCQLQRGT